MTTSEPYLRPIASAPGITLNTPELQKADSRFNEIFVLADENNFAISQSDPQMSEALEGIRPSLDVYPVPESEDVPHTIAGKLNGRMNLAIGRIGTANLSMHLPGHPIGSPLEFVIVSAFDGQIGAVHSPQYDPVDELLLKHFNSPVKLFRRVDFMDIKYRRYGSI